MRKGDLQRVLCVGISLLMAGMASAQNISPIQAVPDTFTNPVTAVAEHPLDSLTHAQLTAVESHITATADSLLKLDAEGIVSAAKQALGEEKWMPDPSRATWTALVFPGGGQIYNRKYWKLPIVYGGFLGCAYALNWNNQMYSDYSQAYLDIMDDDPATASYQQFLPPRYNVAANEAYLKKVFKNRKDLYRRYRDLSIFSFIGVYLLSVIDAYVDAELSHFDISEDLGLHVRPSVIENRNTCSMQAQSYGLQCSLSF
jgi:hypothetical protein